MALAAADWASSDDEANTCLILANPLFLFLPPRSAVANEVSATSCSKSCNSTHRWGKRELRQHRKPQRKSHTKRCRRRAQQRTQPPSAHCLVLHLATALASGRGCNCLCCRQQAPQKSLNPVRPQQQKKSSAPAPCLRLCQLCRPPSWQFSKSKNGRLQTSKPGGLPRRHPRRGPHSQR